MICPIHECELIGMGTSFGTRFYCPEADCTVACWSGKTSTPADAETRELRHKCHEEFDPLWKGRTLFKSRSRAYKWLTVIMGTPEQAHIGQFTKEQCELLLDHLEALKS